MYSVELPIDRRGVAQFGFVFTFDALFSAILLRDAGEGDPKIVSRNHARMLQQLPFEIEIAYNGVAVGTEAPTDLHVTTAGGRVTYRFLVPLQTTLRPPGTIDIRVDDPGVFAAFILRSPDPIEVHATDGATATCERALSPSGAPGPLRCDYAAPEPQRH